MKLADSPSVGHRVSAPDLPAATDPSLPPVAAHSIRPGRPALYVGIVLTVVLVVSGYSVRHDGIFACQASGYGSDRYLAYCQATRYADYDYGAFWFGLEPAALDAASRADVIFLGNSRTQLGFSTPATANWFSSNHVPYYLLGFSYDGNVAFAAPLLRKLQPRARVYVINLDLFFDSTETPPARAVMRDATARGRDEQKRLWQLVHRPLCGRLPAMCGEQHVIFRSRDTGTWVVMGGRYRSSPVSYDEQIDPDVVAAYAATGKGFLSRLPIDRSCVLLTLVPKPGTGSGTAKALADSLGLDLIAPELDGLSTFDGSHLDHASAERWSKAFLEAAGPRIRRCLAAPGT